MIEPIIDIEGGNSYNWARFVVYRHPLEEDRYAVVAASGCSCSIFEEPDLAQLRAAEPLVRAQLRSRLLSFMDGYPWEFSPAETVRNLELLHHALEGRS